MKLIEYQAKEIFGKYGLPIQKGFVARTPEEVRAGLIALKFPVVI
ncbi:MAG: ATP-grasp domain-containing protein, partial [Candidatus Hydrothermia bacterium]